MRRSRAVVPLMAPILRPFAPAAASRCCLALNGGSSTIRFAIDEIGSTARRQLAGKIERIGTPRARLLTLDASSRSLTIRCAAARDHHAAAAFLLRWLAAQPAFAAVQAIGHRVVHGLRHTAPEQLTPRLLAELRQLTAYDPNHLPRALELITLCRRRFPHLPQVACFDTAFHRTMPRVARLLPLPRRYGAAGVERYGFHGLSFAYLLEELVLLGDPAARHGRVILAHLGSGASIAAVRAGRSVDTSMGFTPAAGLVMGTRSGDLDPGLLAFLVRRERMTPTQFDRMVNHESGLRGVSGTSADLRDLLARETRDPRAAEAVELFCYQAKKWIGAYTAALDGLDTLVFAGGIGENSPVIRARICAGLGFLGLTLDARRNARSAALISRDAGRVSVRVVRTDEERMITRATGRLLGLGAQV